MGIFLQGATSIVVLLLTIVLIVKGFQRRSFSVVGEVLAALYVVFAVIMNIFSSFGSTYIHMGIFILLFSFLATHTVYLLTGGFKTPKISVILLNSLISLQEKYSFIINNLTVGIYTLNHKGKFEFINKAFMDITGYSEKELFNMSVYDLAPNETKELIKSNFTKRISGKEEEAIYTTKLLKKSGEIITVRVCAKLTINGHPTITGSVLPIEE